MKLKVTKNQLEYILCPAAEVLFGGSAGGGKSYALMIDALLYALRYPKSRQLVLRRTLPELDKSLVRTARELYPADIFSYSASKHTGSFFNGSVIDFGYCDSPGDMYRYQSAEYDALRFDELTHFTEETYLYLISRLRGANPYPKQVKSCTNPGGLGHGWVKRRFIDPAPGGKMFFGKDGRLAKGFSAAGNDRKTGRVQRGKGSEGEPSGKGGVEFSGETPSGLKAGKLGGVCHSAELPQERDKFAGGYQTAGYKGKGGGQGRKGLEGNMAQKGGSNADVCGEAGFTWTNTDGLRPKVEHPQLQRSLGESFSGTGDKGKGESGELEKPELKAGRECFFKDEVYGELADPLANGIIGSQPGRVIEGTRVFLPSRVQDNPFLMKNDPGYLKRLELLPEKERRALLYGEWDLFEGRYFTEFSRSTHVVEPRMPHGESRIYRAMDYGLDMLACFWIALEPDGRALVMRELYRPGLIISDAAAAILEMEKQDREQGIPPVYMSLAPPDLWNRRQETGRSVADIFGEHGITLVQSGGSRISGWMAVKEWLKPEYDSFATGIKAGGFLKDRAALPLQRGSTAEFGTAGRKSEADSGAGGNSAGISATGNSDGIVPKARPKMEISKSCVNLIRCLPALLHDSKIPNDVAKHPHEITHAPDALRCFCGYWTQPQKPAAKNRSHWTRDMWEDYEAAGAEHRKMMESIWA